jgi:hypothetical protein
VSARRAGELHASDSPSYVSFCTSTTATLMPFSASSSTMLLPMPSLPPVTTTTSLGQSHSSLFQLLTTRSSSQPLTEPMTPMATSAFSVRNSVSLWTASCAPRDVYRAARSSGSVRSGLKAVALKRRVVVSRVQPARAVSMREARGERTVARRRQRTFARKRPLAADGHLDSGRRGSMSTEQRQWQWLQRVGVSVPACLCISKGTDGAWACTPAKRRLGPCSLAREAWGDSGAVEQWNSGKGGVSRCSRGRIRVRLARVLRSRPLAHFSPLGHGWTACSSDCCIRKPAITVCRRLSVALDGHLYCRRTIWS